MNRSYRAWDSRDIDLLRGIRGRGVPLVECAAFLARTVGSVRAATARYGIARRRDKGQRPSRRSEVAALHALGATPREMTVRLSAAGGSSAQIYRDHKALGLPPHAKPFGRVRPHVSLLATRGIAMLREAARA